MTNREQLFRNLLVHLTTLGKPIRNSQLFLTANWKLRFLLITNNRIG
uniref:Arginine-vasopressin receptor 1a n=1 Tax=Nostoc flagelliforme str. Sunitezuoqi TaxID=676037 RepID=E7DQ30_9NOSO|nr:arginine-vasopressin receptor 1a [Nostoc flagelliforme str. Sunitezuoqi]